MNAIFMVADDSAGMNAKAGKRACSPAMPAVGDQQSAGEECGPGGDDAGGAVGYAAGGERDFWNAEGTMREDRADPFIHQSIETLRPALQRERER